MENFTYTLDLETPPQFSEATEHDLPFNHNISVSDEEYDQMIKISPIMRCERGGRLFYIRTEFFYKVPYGQNAINFNEMVNELVYQSFLRQKNLLSSKFSDVTFPDIVRSHNS